MSSIRVGIALSEGLTRGGVECLLASEYNFTVVFSTASAVQISSRIQGAELDVLLTDVPGVIARPLGGENSAPRLVVLLDGPDELIVYRMLTEGVVGFVTQKEDPGVLLDALRSVAKGEVPWISPRVTTSLVTGRHAAEVPSVLTDRERRILKQVALGRSNHEIAEELELSSGTVRNQLSRIYGKLDVRGRTEAVAWAWRRGLIEP